MMLPLCLAALGLAVSAIDHVATFFGIDLHVPFPALLWGLHVLGMLLGALLVLGALPVPSEKSGRRLTWGCMTRYAPRWMKAITLALLIYGAFNCVTILVLSKGGTTAIENGKEVLVSHGRVICPLSAEDYERFRVYPTRLFSGFWMPLYAVFVTVFLSMYNGMDVDRADRGETRI
jgi:hypothetical protein